MTPLKAIDKMSYVEIKRESLIRSLPVIGVMTSKLKTSLEQHRIDNPEFDLENATKEYDIKKSKSNQKQATVKTTEPVAQKTEAMAKKSKTKPVKKAAKKAAAKKTSKPAASAKKAKAPRKTNGESVSARIREMHEKGKTVSQIKESLGKIGDKDYTKGHYVNDIVWRIKNA